MKIWFFYHLAWRHYLSEWRQRGIAKFFLFFFLIFHFILSCLLSFELRITHLLRTKFEVKTKKVFFVFSLSSFLLLFRNFFWETEVMRLSTWKIHFLWNVFFIWKVKTAKWHAKRCRQTDRQTDSVQTKMFVLRDDTIYFLLFAEISNF